MQKLKNTGKKKFAARLGFRGEAGFRTAGLRRLVGRTARFGAAFLRGCDCAAIICSKLRLSYLAPQSVQNFFRQPCHVAGPKGDHKIARHEIWDDLFRGSVDVS